MTRFGVEAIEAAEAKRLRKQKIRAAAVKAEKARAEGADWWKVKMIRNSYREVIATVFLSDDEIKSYPTAAHKAEFFNAHKAQGEEQQKVAPPSPTP